MEYPLSIDHIYQVITDCICLIKHSVTRGIFNLIKNLHTNIVSIRFGSIRDLREIRYICIGFGEGALIKPLTLNNRGKMKKKRGRPKKLSARGYKALQIRHETHDKLMDYQALQKERLGFNIPKLDLVDIAVRRLFDTDLPDL